MMTISEIKIEISELEDKLKEESKLTGYDIDHLNGKRWCFLYLLLHQ